MVGQHQHVGPGQEAHPVAYFVGAPHQNILDGGAARALGPEADLHRLGPFRQFQQLPAVELGIQRRELLALLIVADQNTDEIQRPHAPELHRQLPLYQPGRYLNGDLLIVDVLVLVLRQLTLDDQVRAVGFVGNRNLGRGLALGQLLPCDAQKVLPRIRNGNGLGAGLDLGQGQTLVRHLQILRLGAGLLLPVLAVLEGVGAHQLRPGDLRIAGQLRQGHILHHVPADHGPPQHQRLGRTVGHVGLDGAVRLRREVGRLAGATE